MNGRALAMAAAERVLVNTMAHAPNAVAAPFSGLVARHAGRLLYPRAEVLTRDNIRRLRPDLDVEQAMAEMWDNLMRSVLEVPRIHRIVAEGRLRVHGGENLLPGPVVALALHLGNWELLPPSMALSGLPTAAIFQPVKESYRMRQLAQQRQRYIRKLLPGGPGVTRAALRALSEDRGVLGIFIDEFVGGVVRGPSLGRAPRRSGNIATAVRLAKLAGARVTLGWCRRSPGPFFDVTCLPLDLPDDLEAAIDHVDAVAGEIVLRNLPQWFMLHEWRPEN